MSGLATFHDSPNRTVPPRRFTTQLEEGRLGKADKSDDEDEVSTRTTGRDLSTRTVPQRRSTRPIENEDIGEVHEMADLIPMSLESRIAALEFAQATRGQGAKITPWRVLNTVVTMALGGYKAFATYRGQTFAPTTVDWIVGVVWASIVYWVSFCWNGKPT